MANDTNILAEAESRQEAIREVLEQHISGKDVTAISETCKIAKSTVYKYLTIKKEGLEKESVNLYNQLAYDSVINKAIEILKQKSIELSALLEKI